MNKDIIVAEDEDVKIIFHFKVFCELLKKCISIYGNTTIENAQQVVKDFHPLQQPINTTDDIVFFSHENIYHWAMLALYGETYWFTHPECEKLCGRPLSGAHRLHGNRPERPDELRLFQPLLS